MLVDRPASACAVVFGIIIDTFSDLRGQAKEKSDEMMSYCFICNIDRGELDKEAGGFEPHVKKDHNVRGCMLPVPLFGSPLSQRSCLTVR